MNEQFSECGTMRYWLERDCAQLDSSGSIAFIMLNPSTADGETDDPTIRRCQAFARREGRSRLLVANLFGKRSTDPMGLKGQPGEGFNEGERSAWYRAFRESDMVIAAWGAPKADWMRRIMEPRILQVLNYRDEFRRPLYCLGTTKAGHPRHPLYVKGSAPLKGWAHNVEPAPSGAQGEGGAS